MIRSFATKAALAFAFGAALLWNAAALAAKRPNIVFIFADDLGWSDVGCQGARYYETPNIDRLAREGLRFTDACMAAPNCAPSRAALYSGQYGPRTGMYCVGGSERGQARWRNVVPPRNRGDLDLSKITLGQALQSAGYTTALFGKWHLGYGEPYLPARRGFDEAFALIQPTANGYWAPHFAFLPPLQARDGDYLGDFLGDQALDFLERHRNDARPFFLNINQFLVHGPLQAPEDIIAKYKTKPADGKDANPVFAAMVEKLDWNVGRILAKLDELDLARNTVVVFSSDNGGVGGYADLGILGAEEHTSNLPLKGGKTQLYEGGIRVPLIVRWPSVVDPGSVSNDPVINLDFYPTFLDIAGGEAPGDYPLDGKSFAGVLRSSGREGMPQRDLFWHFPAYALAPGGADEGQWRSGPQSAIRSGDWKLIEFLQDETVELYNLRDDPGETRELSAEAPDKARELLAKLSAWREETGAAIPYRKQGGNRGEPIVFPGAANQPGMHGVWLNPQLARLQYYEGESGLFLYDVDPGSPAERAGLQASDIILEIDGRPLEGPESLAKAVEPGSAQASIVYWRIKERETTLRLSPPELRASSAANLAGVWIRQKGNQETRFELKPDGSFETDSGAKGEWTIEGEEVVLEWKGASATRCVLLNEDAFAKAGSNSQIWRRAPAEPRQ
ncbi:MAG: Arylsulfatase [candidate division BRC1 bacterium ADurb.BinA364]|nr:MAG: Arylsulfatase [candidate division BRC1 bacterium ADurb.BinA364]